ncbi:MAG: SIR2 family protein [Candidatus Margulisiibacteriota bacterium]
MTDKKVLLLTGSGFTKNFGGFLASDMSEMLYTDPNIIGLPDVRQMMKDNFNFENVYTLVMNDDAYDPTVKKKVRSAIASAYKTQEEKIDETKTQYSPNTISAIPTFLKRHVEFFFTLNQDLFVEDRFTHNLSGRSLTMPASPTNLNGFDKKKDVPLHPKEEFEKRRAEEEKRLSKPNKICYFKLHGSSNWLGSERRELAVIVGSDKPKKFPEPLLEWYKSIFINSIGRKNQTLLIIGYGFNDEWVNEELCNAIDNHSLSGVIIDVVDRDTFREKMTKEKEKANKPPHLTKVTDKAKHEREKKNDNLRVKIYNAFSYFPINSLGELFSSKVDLGRLKNELGLPH